MSISPGSETADRRMELGTTRGVGQLVPVDPATRATIRILIVDDERTLRESCASALAVDGYNATVCGRGEEAQELLRRRAFDIVLIYLYMGQVPGMQLLSAALATNPDTIAIVITGKPSVETSIETLRAGAWDYLPKPFTGAQLQILVGRAAHAVHVGRETQALRAGATVGADEAVGMGSAPTFREAIALARRVATTDASVFITGESGSGKEMIAQFIH